MYYISSKCPYCGAGTHIDKAKNIKSFVEPAFEYKNVLLCDNYPVCDSYVFFNISHDEYPGIVADKHLRYLKMKTHIILDIIWKSDMLAREKIYELIKMRLKYKTPFQHVRYYRVNECIEVMLLCLKYIYKHHIKVRTTDALSDEQKNILKYISESNVFEKSHDLKNKDIKDILSLIYNDKYTKVFSCSRKFKTVSLIIEKNMTVYSAEGENLEEFILSFANEYHNKYLENNGYGKSFYE